MTIAVINVILTLALPIYEGRQGPAGTAKHSQAETVIWRMVIIQAGPHCSTREFGLLHGGITDNTT